jgi:sugar phosphate isomerase/epimerase
MVSAWLPPEEYQSLDSIGRVCDRFNEAAAVAAARGISLGIHNHWWEFEQVAGRRPYQLWLERLDPSIFFELDTYWVQVGGVDPVTALAEMGDRAQLVHVKDGPADNSQADMTAVGTGNMDYNAIIAAATAAEWLVVELDRCATDMMTAVQESYTYLTQKGLAHGKV